MDGLGPHIVLDGYQCDKDKLDDIDFIFDVLDEFPDRIGMTKIMPPYAFRHGEGVEAGISGFVLIAESHISIHTFPEKRFLNLDIFSCESFDTREAVRFVREAFRIRRVSSKLLHRGREFPRDLRASRKIVLLHRGSVRKELVRKA
jgi:S-adenosylmethionine decarboxylase